MQRDIFLCHTGADKAWVEELATRLERETIDGRQVVVFFDKWDIDGGENLLTKIEQGLQTSRFVGVVLSPAMTKADWPTLEWQTQVYEDPAGKKGRILPILRHHTDPVTGEPIEIPLPLKILGRYDFTVPKKSEGEFQRLLRRLRGQRPPRGAGFVESQSHGLAGQEDPTGDEESIVSNLLFATRLPASLWSDESTLEHPRDVIDQVQPRIPFLSRGGRLWSFYNPELRGNPFRHILTGRFRREERVTDWLTDGQKRPRLIQLLNDGLRNHCYKRRIKGLGDDREHYFCPTTKGSMREFQWGPGGRTRTLAKIVPAPDGSSLGVHHAAWMRFIVLGSSVYLLIQPGWAFTTDGVTPVDGRAMGILSTRWGGKERNAAVLRNVLMWGLLLRDGPGNIVIDLGSDSIELEPVPAHARVSVGVDNDEIRLDRLLAGAGGGEIIGTQTDDDLDNVVELRDLGLLEPLNQLDDAFPMSED
jgi:hypothetical protein